MHADLQLHHRVAAAGTLTAAQAFIAVAVVIAVLLAVFAPTTRSMVDTWRRSETFTHGFLVLPAVLAFVWIRRDALARVAVRPALSGLVVVAAAGALWLAGALSNSLAPAQFGVIAMVPGALATLFGWAWVRALAFPLAFLFFAVPFGEVFVPQLIDWTADFTVAAVSASGVPVYREGTNFVIPSGRWSVVEACSGIRYLIASVMLGSLYAWIVYRSPRRRALFITAAIAVPLVANWLRAYAIVMLGHLSNNRIATGVDHLIYGWIFFGALMLLMFWVGSRWREDGAAPPAAVSAPAGPASPAISRAAWGRALLLLTLAVLVWPLAEALLVRDIDARPLPPVSVSPSGGWRASDGMVPGNWQPDIAGAARTQVLSFAKGGREVAVVVALFRNQRQGAELVTSTNQLVDPANARWHLVTRRAIELADARGTFPARAALIRGQGTQLVAAQWYWLGTRRTTSDTVAKFDLAIDRLLARGDTSAWVIVVAPARDGFGDAMPVIAEFVREVGADLDAALAEAAAR